MQKNIPKDSDLKVQYLFLLACQYFEEQNPEMSVLYI